MFLIDNFLFIAFIAILLVSLLIQEKTTLIIDFPDLLRETLRVSRSSYIFLRIAHDYTDHSRRRARVRLTVNNRSSGVI